MDILQSYVSGMPVGKRLSFYHFPLQGDLFGGQLPSLLTGWCLCLPPGLSRPLPVAMPVGKCQPLTFLAHVFVTIPTDT